ncbi:MAG: YCF48-related protein [Melioribacteraceae bacterium]
MKVIPIFLTFFVFNITTIAQTFWIQQTSPTSNTLECIKTIDSNVVWACGQNGTVLRTINGGTDWTITNSPNAEWDCISIEAIDANTAWVASVKNNGGNTTLYKTIDGGVTWTIKQSSNENECFYNAVKFYDKDHGILYGDPENGYFTIYTTEDGGETWLRTDSSKIPSPNGAEYGVINNLAISGNYAWFGTQNDNNGINARVFRSEDRGKTWSAIPIEEYSFINTISFSTDSYGIIVCNNNEVGYTRDGGLTWKIQWVPLIGSSSSFATASSFILVGGPWSNISTDGGVTWEQQETNARGFEAVSFANSFNGWTVGFMGEIYKWIGDALPDLPVSLNDKFENNVPSEFKLEQNYPNPFNPSTTIEYSIPQKSQVIVQVYDLLGREITTLINEEKAAGNYSVKFDGSNFNSGVYFYKLTVGEFSNTKKLVLLK